MQSRGPVAFLSSGAYRVFTSVKTGFVNMHVLCINTGALAHAPSPLSPPAASFSLSFLPFAPSDRPRGRVQGVRRGRAKVHV